MNFFTWLSLLTNNHNCNIVLLTNSPFAILSFSDASAWLREMTGKIGGILQVVSGCMTLQAPKVIIRWGQEQMRARLEDPNNNSELFTHSDEAFTLVVLENYWDRWIDECKDGMPRPQIESRRKKEVKLNIEPKYTSGGIIYDGGKRQNPGRKGWTKK